MKLVRVNTPEKSFFVLWFGKVPESLASDFTLTRPALASSLQGNSDTSFLFSRDSSVLVKLHRSPPTYVGKPYKWIKKELLQSRILFRNLTFKEFKSQKKLERLGFDIPKTYGWGVVLNPFSKIQAIMSSEFLAGSVDSREVIAKGDDEVTRGMVAKWSQELGKLYAKGYYHTDPHIGNFLFHERRSVWIDSRIKPVEIGKKGEQSVFDYYKKYVSKYGEEVFQHFAVGFYQGACS
ncbi:lipopolysaccharide kinase InaA family protein [Aliagarivorans taiwanensis]|uniref:lipopolysaccharide kinase InaA family protein n=1 Tax=Aliagarivorans taiwanensis TaxID=561966 RepID=UPI000479D46C|nr:lipopolysaccharide kinase InaA family protein [Aliagarivorans taiwanensis]